MGPSGASWTGLRDWNEMMGHELRSWEILAIARCCNARAIAQSEKIERESKQKRGAK